MLDTAINHRTRMFNRAYEQLNSQTGGMGGDGREVPPIIYAHAWNVPPFPRNNILHKHKNTRTQ